MNKAFALANTGIVDATALSEAQVNLTAAQTAVTNYLAEGNHADYNKILVDIKAADIENTISIENHFDAINACVPDNIAAYQAEMLEEIKTDLGYADMTAEE